MNKYIVKATAQVAVLMAFGAVVSGIVSLVLAYFKPSIDEIIMGLGVSFMAFILYNLIQIRASSLEVTDRLKEMK